MFFPYSASLAFVFLALCGVWLIVKDVWDWWCEPRLVKPPSMSFLVVVKNAEQEVEYYLRYFLNEVEAASTECDVVVVDRGSEDMTLMIVDRLAEEYPFLQVIRVPEAARAVPVALALCRGAVIHILDLAGRLSMEEFVVTACSLLKKGDLEVRVKEGQNG